MTTSGDPYDLSMIIFLIIVAWVFYVIGVYFNIKIFKVAKEDKDITWKLDITNSCLLLFFNLNALFMRSITYFVDDVYMYTGGSWFCYTSKVIIHYGVLYIIGHSLIVAIMKYVNIVHWKKTRMFGKEKVQEMFFWINFLHPAVLILFQLMIRPDFFWAYDGMPQIDRCLGDPKHNWDPGANRSLTKLHNICEIVEPINVGHLEYIIHLVRIIACGFNVALYYILMWNLLEMFFYCQIFGFMRR